LSQSPPIDRRGHARTGRGAGGERAWEEERPALPCGEVE
jgi:hypothetical protein